MRGRGLVSWRLPVGHMPGRTRGGTGSLQVPGGEEGGTEAQAGVTKLEPCPNPNQAG